jgi:tetratricopeptide (TPR) repeat protein
MVKDIITICPRCQQETVLAVAVPEPGSDVGKKASATSCRKCKARILALTHPDGTVQLVLWEMDDPDPKPLAAVATLGSVFGLADILRIPYALWQPRGEEIGEFKHRPEWAEALRDALLDAQAKPRPLSVPRRIFISYRWGAPQEDAWVDTLRRELEARGNYVEFDRKAQREERPPSVPELVARIAGCHVFLAVLDPGYIERVAAVASASVAEGWVTDEFHTALAFADKGILTLLGLLRDGDRLPVPFRAFVPGEAGNTFDVRSREALLLILDRFFVQFGAVPEESTARDAAAAALHASRRAFDAGDAQVAFDRADEACRLVPGLADGFAQRARVAYRLKRPAEALRDARLVLEIDPTMDEMLIYAAASANDLGEWREAARMGRVALERNRAQANAHYLVGKALSELDQVDAALAHFEIARKSRLMLPDLYNEAGWAWRRAGDPVKGLEWYGEGLKIAPLDAVLLANSTAAAMEAGRAMEALQMLVLLAKHHPHFQDLGFLTSTLAHWCQEEGLPPPVLSRRSPRPLEVGTVACGDCGAQIPLADEKQMLCGGCGAVLPPSIDPCFCCDSPWKVVPASILGFSCPYCGSGGALRYAPKASGE